MAALGQVARACISLFAALSASLAHATVTLLDGTEGQHAPAMMPFAAPIVVRVVDDAGAPIAGAEVSLEAPIPFSASQQTSACAVGTFGEGYYCSVQTDANGIARFPTLRGRGTT